MKGHAPDFGKAHATEFTVWRRPQETFEPAYRIDQSTHDDFRAVERSDHGLFLMVSESSMRRELWDDANVRRAFGAVALDGSPLNLSEVEAVLDRGRADGDSPHETEVLNYSEFVWALGFHPPPVPKGPNEVLAFHEALFRGVLPDAGRFKEARNFTLNDGKEVVHVAAMPEDVETELENLLQWLHEAPEHPLVRVSVFFHEFLSIAPFRHGNDRVANAVALHFLQSNGYPYVVFAAPDYEMNHHRDLYKGAFEAGVRGELGPWVGYMARVLHAAFDRPARRALFRRELPRGLDPRIVTVADWIARRHWLFLGMEVKAGKIVEEFPDIPKRTLQRGLTTLVEAGVLRRIGAGSGTAYTLAT